MLTLLLYPFQLLAFALRYWTLPTLIVLGAAVTIPTVLLVTGGPRQLSASEYQAWCAERSHTFLDTIVQASSWGEVEDYFRSTVQEAEDFRPPISLQTEHDAFIEANEELASLPSELTSHLDQLFFLSGLATTLFGALTGEDLRQKVMSTFLDSGISERLAMTTFGGFCGVEYSGTTASLEPLDDQQQAAQAQPNDQEQSSFRQDQNDTGVSTVRDGGSDTQIDTESQANAQRNSDDSREQPTTGSTSTNSQEQEDSESNSCQVKWIDLGNLSESITVDDDLETSDCGPEHHYVFSLNRSELLTIALQSADFDAYLALNDWSAGVRLLDNDDFAGCCDARIQTELSSGQYLLTVSSYNFRGIGHYRLTIALEQKTTSTSDSSAQDNEPMPDDSGLISDDQFIGDHGGFINHDFGRTMPQLAARLTDREREIQLGPWFYRHLFQFSDEKVSHDANLGLIGYNYYNSNWPSSVCRNSEGDPFSYGWDAQPYEATPDGRRGVSDWRTRSWHSVYSVIHGTVVYVDEQLGEIAIFDGRNTIYYKHLNEIDWRIIPDELTGDDGVASVGVEVFPGDYLGRMGMRGTAIAPHLTLEVRAGLPPHDLCPPEGTATSPLPYLHRLLGGR